jgi:hypothetical protein
MVALANGVKRFPSTTTGNGLNLSRGVEYAAAHPNEDWQFPRDFQKLTITLRVIRAEPRHFDSAFFTRFRGGSPSPAGPLVALTPFVPFSVPQTARPNVASMPAAPAPAAPPSNLTMRYASSNSQTRAARSSNNKQPLPGSLSEDQQQSLGSMTDLLPSYVHPSMVSSTAMPGPIHPDNPFEFSFPPARRQAQERVAPTQPWEAPVFDQEDLARFDPAEARSDEDVDTDKDSRLYNQVMGVDLGYR